MNLNQKQPTLLHKIWTKITRSSEKILGLVTPSSNYSKIEMPQTCIELVGKGTSQCYINAKKYYLPLLLCVTDGARQGGEVTGWRWLRHNSAQTDTWHRFYWLSIIDVIVAWLCPFASNVDRARGSSSSVRLSCVIWARLILLEDWDWNVQAWYSIIFQMFEISNFFERLDPALNSTTNLLNL